MKSLSKKISVFTTLFIGLLFLPGCDMFWGNCKKSSVTYDGDKVSKSDAVDQKEVLLSIDGRPAITIAQFEDHLDKIVSANPQVSSVINQVPTMKYNIFSGMMSQELLKVWAEKSNITNRDDYKEDLELMRTLVEYELARKYFQQDVEKDIKVSSAEIKQYYDTNKAAIPDLIASPGGVKTLAVVFENETKANAFLSLDNIEKDFKKHAETRHLEIKDLGLVSQYSIDVDKKVKERLAKAKTFPSIARVKTDDKKLWVCLAQEKEETKYRSLEEVKEGIEGMLKNQKMQVTFGQKIEALKTVYRAEENKGYFDQKGPEELLAEQEEAAGSLDAGSSDVQQKHKAVSRVA